MLNKMIFTDKQFSEEDEENFAKAIRVSGAIALSKVGGLNLPNKEFKEQLYKEFKEALFKKLSVV